MKRLPEIRKTIFHEISCFFSGATAFVEQYIIINILSDNGAIKLNFHPNLPMFKVYNDNLFVAVAKRC